MKYLLDTCVISELISKQPNAGIVAWVDSIDDERFYLSAITIGEIQRGVEKLPASARKTELNGWLHHALLSRFQGRILAIDTAAMLTWGGLVAQLETTGRILPAMDSLIAALALQHDLQLVTRNEKDFAGSGVTLINPWTSSPAS